jgi:hypothetical protein
MKSRIDPSSNMLSSDIVIQMQAWSLKNINFINA